MSFIPLFPNHTNNNNEIIDANDINFLQSIVEGNYEESVILKANQFKNHLLFQLEHSSIVHGLEYADLIDGFRQEIVKDDEFIHTTIGLTLSEKYSKRLFVSEVFTGMNELSKMNHFLFRMQGEFPAGSTCKAYLKIGNDLHELDQTTIVPFELPHDIDSFQIAIELTRSSLQESPFIRSYGVMFSDTEAAKAFTINRQ